MLRKNIYKKQINHSQSNIADLIWKMLDRIDRGDTSGWNLVGHSTGGRTAEAMTLERPYHTKSLVLVDAEFFGNTAELNHGEPSILKIPAVKEFYDELQKDKLITFEDMGHFLNSGYGRKPDTSDVTGHLMPMIIPGTAGAIESVFSNCSEKQVLDAAALKGIPVMAIWGTLDKWIPARSASKIKKYARHPEIRKIKGAANMPMETNAIEFNSILVEFLNRNNKGVRSWELGVGD